MSDKPIAVGDLVMVVRVCCKDPQKILGYIFRVHRLDAGGGHCNCCRKQFPEVAAWQDAALPIRAPLSWLKRIDPLAEPEHTERKEELTA